MLFVKVRSDDSKKSFLCYPDNEVSARTRKNFYCGACETGHVAPKAGAVCSCCKAVVCHVVVLEAARGGKLKVAIAVAEKSATETAAKLYQVAALVVAAASGVVK